MMRTIFFVCILLVTFCVRSVYASAAIRESSQDYIDYKQIPTVTQDDINAIEAIKAQKPYLTYAVLSDTARCVFFDEISAEFAHGFFSLLSSLLGIEFTAQKFGTVKNIKEKLTDKEVDFSTCLDYDFNLTNIYRSSAPIAGRLIDDLKSGVLQHSPVMYTPVLLTTANSDLAPVISVLDKYIDFGGKEKLFELYREKKLENSRRKLFASFTPEERAFAESLKIEDRTVNIGLLHDAYPACFYNTVENKYQGIAVQTLKEITELTGIKFRAKTTTDVSTLAQMLDMLKTGEISMHSQLLYSESRKDDFVWSKVPYFSTKYALISKLEFPNLADYQVHYYKVGTINRSVHEEMFNLWYPDHKNRTVYESGMDALDALERGEVDLLMVTEGMLLALTNYREKTGYKINVSFNAYQESRFGYNKNEELLASIVDKSMAYIDIENIQKYWLNHSFDYSEKYFRMRMYYMTLLIIVGVVAFIILFFILMRNLRLNRKLRLQAVQLKDSEAKAQKALNAKGEFLAQMSHEMRTPMNAIMGMSQLLENENLTEGQHGFVKDIRDASSTLLSIVNDVLDMAKIESGKVNLTLVDYDFDQLVSNIGSMFRFLAHKKGLDFRYEKRGELPLCLYGDDIKLRQVLMNICANAVNYTNSGFVSFTVSSSGDKLVFEVKDSGMGIKEEDLKTLFDPFARLDVKKHRNIKGSGLGLAISKSFTEMMSGTISVESKYGRGSVFTVTIPKVTGDQNNIARAAANGKKITFAAPQARILLVDDNSLNLKVAQGLLGLYSISPDMVTSGMESISAVQNKNYDIVFMDHMMSEMDGVETVKRIRALGGKYEHLVIAALTANAIQGAREMFLANGFNDFLTKPIELDKLGEVLERWIPADKREKLDADNIPLVTEHCGSRFLDTVSKIASIDFKAGIQVCFNNPKVYHETLQLFCGKLLSDCNRLESFLQAGDIADFAVLVHGVKTSLATVGALKLSKTAFELEKAAKAENLKFCCEQSKPFIEELRSLYEELSKVFEPDEPQKKLPAGDSDFLDKNIRAALNAALDFDGGAGVDILCRLLTYDYGEEINGMLKDALEAFKEFDFDSASGFLNKVKGSKTEC